MSRWSVIGVLSAAQFVMVLDTTVMNVSISQVVDDLDTDVVKMQLAITAYALVMASFMLTGAKLGDIMGRRRTLAVGLVVYGAGSAVTALSPNIGTLLFGWSLLEGLGAALVIPAIASLIAGNYTGRMRALAYGVMGGVAGAGAALGPLIGGWMTTNLSWRLVFAGEVVVILVILVTMRIIRDAPPSGERPRLDPLSVVLSAAGMMLAVLGILQSSQWGLIEATNPPEIAGVEIAPFGFSPVPFLILGGLGVLLLFMRRQEALQASGRTPLLSPDLLRVPQLRAGATGLVAQQVIIGGVFFVLPLYLQVVLGKDALETGLAILPLSVGLFAFALVGSRLSASLPPRTVVRAGLLSMLAAVVFLIGSVDLELRETGFAIGLLLVGAGLGLLASQLGNVIMSAVPEEDSAEAGGVQGTAQNLGMSIGTALVGAVLIAGLTTALQENVRANPALTPEVVAAVDAAAARGISLVPSSTVETAAREAGLPAAQVSGVVSAYEDAQISALKRSLAIVGVFVLIGFRTPPRPEHRRGPASGRRAPHPRQQGAPLRPVTQPGVGVDVPQRPDALQRRAPALGERRRPRRRHVGVVVARHHQRGERQPQQRHRREPADLLGGVLRGIHVRGRDQQRAHHAVRRTRVGPVRHQRAPQAVGRQHHRGGRRRDGTLQLGQPLRQHRAVPVALTQTGPSERALPRGLPVPRPGVPQARDDQHLGGSGGRHGPSYASPRRARRRAGGMDVRDIRPA